jgi:hypothetical protein
VNAGGGIGNLPVRRRKARSEITPYLNLAKSQAFRTKKYLYLALADQT